jgi:hypothetical protein
MPLKTEARALLEHNFPSLIAVAAILFGTQGINKKPEAIVQCPR